MLVLTRKRLEAIRIGSGIRLEVLDVLGGKARFGITAPESVRILREEIVTEEEDEDPDGLEAILPSLSIGGFHREG